MSLEHHDTTEVVTDEQLPWPAGLPTSGVRAVELAVNERTRVARVWLPDGSTVIWKESTGPGAVARRRHELAVLRRLAGVPGVARLAEVSHPDALVLADDGGGALSATISDTPWDVTRAVRLGVALARVVAQVHARGVVHKDINPANVLVTDDGRPVLIDFDVANTFAEDRPGFANVRDIVGTLSYLPPEQTGRTGLPVDHRADLYSLGATLYEVLTGQRPFDADDELRLIHDILLRVPVPLVQVRADVPAVLSDIVARLFEKEPDRRYQSAEGLAHDLACLMDESDAVRELGRWDFPLRLSAPSRLVGRDRESADLDRAFDEAVSGKARAVLVAGAPGVGKSALINELRQPVAARGGWYVTGKSDQFAHDNAVGSVLQAIRGIGRLLLAEPNRTVTALRQRLAEELSINIGLITAVLPEFAMLLGADHQSMAIDPAEHELRLRQAVLAVLRVVVGPDRPLVLVIDDLQWADPVSLGLFDAVLTEPDLDGLLVLGAYRSQEVDTAHPLSAMMGRWQRLGVVDAPVQLENLPPGQADVLVGEVLRLPTSRARALAAVLHRWTSGNPYDTLELINALRRGGVLTLADDGWRWDDRAIEDHVGQTGVVAILQERVDRLPVTAQRLLQAMACLGGETEMQLLARALDVPVAVVVEQLVPPLEEGLLVMIDGGRADEALRVRFRHDRVQQAVFVALDDGARTLLRLFIARRLAEFPDHRVKAAEQYLGAAEAVGDLEERRKVVPLYRVAADNAWRAGNHLTAERFLAAAASILTELGAGHDLDLQAVWAQQHAALYALGRLDEADGVYAAIERGHPDPIDLSVAANIQLSSLAHRSKHAEALRLGLSLLALLGSHRPGQEFGRTVPAQCREVVAWANGLDLANDLARPEITDPTVIATSRLFSRLLPVTFLLGEPMVGTWILLETWRLWVRYGPSAHIVAILSGIGTTLAAVNGDFHTGYVVGRHALAISEARTYEPITALVRYRCALQLMCWVEPLENAVDQARSAYEGLIRGGDLHMAGAAKFIAASMQLDLCRSVEAWAAEVEEVDSFAIRTGNAFTQRNAACLRQVARALLGQTSALGSSDNTFFSDEHLAKLGPNPFARGIFHVYCATTAAIFGDEAALDRHTAAAMDVRQAIAGYPLMLCYLLRAMSLADQLRRDPLPERDDLLTELDTCRDWIAARAEDAPGNFRHLLALADAERAWARGDLVTAGAAFDLAANDVETRQRPWHRAIIVERAAVFQLALGHVWQARWSLAEARQAYASWGAVAKVRQLDAKYPSLRGVRSARASAVRPGTVRATTGHINADAIDTLAILRASQALSSATDLDQLQLTIVEQLTALTGASDVRLVIRDEEHGNWFLPGGARTDQRDISVEDAGAEGLLPLSAFEYAERTEEALLVQDATRDDRFARDPYLTGAARCSLLVVPVRHSGALRAMLLLTNRETSGLFTTERLDAVILIAGQLVVSLNNALLYASLEQRVADRTRELGEANHKLEILSSTDALTNLPNRRQFEEMLNEQWHRADRVDRSFGLIMIDVDFFKTYNDEYGHQGGDECLRRVGAALAGAVRGATDLACRYGGEEFVVILGETDDIGAHVVAERVRTSVRALRIPHIAGVDGTLSVSVGVATAHVPIWESSDELLARADAALYRAKEGGRNQVQIAPPATLSLPAGTGM
ncbi:MAG: hypothetical protein QOH97_2570 [Actinoplanes sp.]|nr:hypothetical protein [Actinoplanes sp.]